jgi:hypothetical protein
MPRPKSNPSPTPLSPGQAAYVLDQLIKERRISQGEISRYVNDMGREISDLEARLQRLREAHGGAAASSAPAASASSVRRPGRPPGSGKKGPGRPGRPPGRPAASAAPAAAAASAGGANKGGAKKGGRKSAAAITAEQLASRQLQGRYLSLVRQFPEKKRAEYARIAKEKGREAAIKAMQDDKK